MKLNTISIAGFRFIADLKDLITGSPTLLTGHNDAGKTAILDAVSFLLNDYSLTERDPTYASVGGPVPAVGTQAPRVKCTSVEGLFELSYEEQALLGLPGTLRLRRIAANGSPAAYEYFSMAADNEKLQGYAGLTNPQLEELISDLGLVKSGGGKPALLAVLDAAAAAAPQIELWIPAPVAAIKSLPRVQRFNPSGTTDAQDAIRSALQVAYKKFAEADKFSGSIATLEAELQVLLVAEAESIRSHIMSRCADIGSVQILPSVSIASGTGLKATQISVTGTAGEDVHLGEAGAGRARRVSLAVWEFTTGLLEDAGDVVILYDEPDTHLDYAHQREFMHLVRSQCALPNVKMMIATHSMNLIDGIDISDVVHIRHNAESRTVAEYLGDHSQVGQHLGAVAAALGLRNTVLLNERLFVGVEGATEIAALPVLFRLATGQQLEACGIAIWACNNNEGAVSFAEFLVSHGRNVAFLVDRDSKTLAKHVFSDAKLLNRQLDPNVHGLYIGDPSEIEDLFGNDLWVDVANSAWCRTDRPWVESDIEAHRSGKFSRDILEMFRTKSETGPSGKPDMVGTLALHLSQEDQVPPDLRAIFAELIARAT
ncbi:TOPRIM nucleotidyl transferase/hydrolase domain-containing protein [Cryobacterium sp.]|uniref:ATP-dependent nuclease n=1 Tax=Cryobacterium sp. TaxID=1926290 RepID=UPI002613E120|nr:TOPRIM nucleotidyl transferase/hydrolase domain-containing protein [Cryobacterium sp.]